LYSELLGSSLTSSSLHQPRSQILAWQANTGVNVGDPITARAAGEEGRDLADAIGDRPDSRICLLSVVFAQLMEGDVNGAVAGFRGLIAECEADHDELLKPVSRMGLGVALAHQGEFDAAYAAASTALEISSGLDDYSQGMGHAALAVAALAAECDAHDALACATSCGCTYTLPTALSALADLARDADSQQAARLFGAAEAFRQRMGMVRFKVHQAGDESSVAALRDVMDEKDFDAAWAEGAALSTEEAIAYAQRGRGERKRPNSRWASLTPAENDVVRLVCDGLPNKDIATRLFVSPRTVRAHLSHVYTKLGLSSRV
jgi:DNA-binding CsgD family transcriptional regulator